MSSMESFNKENLFRVLLWDATFVFVPFEVSRGFHPSPNQ